MNLVDSKPSELQEPSDSSLQGTLSVSGAPGPFVGSSDLAPSAAHALYVKLNPAHLYTYMCVLSRKAKENIFGY